MVAHGCLMVILYHLEWYLPSLSFHFLAGHFVLLLFHGLIDLFSIRFDANR